MSYQDEIAQIRAQRAQSEVAQRVETLRADHLAYSEARDNAARLYHSTTDPEEREQASADYHCCDKECEALEFEASQIIPRQPEPLSPQTQQYLAQRQSFNQRYGDRAAQAYTAAHQLAVNAGLQPDSKDYFSYIDDALELHGGAYNGVRFDPNEKAISATEAARISGVAPDLYNKMQQKMFGQGRDSGALQRQAWSKKVG